MKVDAAHVEALISGRRGLMVSLSKIEDCTRLEDMTLKWHPAAELFPA